MLLTIEQCDEAILLPVNLFACAEMLEHIEHVVVFAEQNMWADVDDAGRGRFMAAPSATTHCVATFEEGNPQASAFECECTPDTRKASTDDGNINSEVTGVRSSCAQ